MAQARERRRTNTMSDVTIKQLALVLGMPVDKLLGQLGEAGMK